MKTVTTRELTNIPFYRKILILSNSFYKALITKQNEKKIYTYFTEKHVNINISEYNSLKANALL